MEHSNTPGEKVHRKFGKPGWCNSPLWCDRLPAVLVLLKVLPRWVARLLLWVPILGARLRRAAAGLMATTTWGPGGYGAPRRIGMVSAPGQDEFFMSVLTKWD